MGTKKHKQTAAQRAQAGSRRKQLRAKIIRDARRRLEEILARPTMANPLVDLEQEQVSDLTFGRNP